MSVKFLEIKIKIMSKILYLWDVFFTMVDIYQLKVYIHVKNTISTQKVRLSDLKKYDKLSVEEFDSWKDIK